MPCGVPILRDPLCSYRVRRRTYREEKDRQSRAEALPECLASRFLKLDLQLVLDPVHRTLHPPPRGGMNHGLFVRLAWKSNHHLPNLPCSKPPANGCVWASRLPVRIIAGTGEISLVGQIKRLAANPNAPGDRKSRHPADHTRESRMCPADRQTGLLHVTASSASNSFL